MLTHLVLHFLGGLVADDVGIGGGVHCALFYSGDIDSEAEVRDTKDRITIVHGRRAAELKMKLIIMCRCTYTIRTSKGGRRREAIIESVRESNQGRRDNRRMPP